MKRFALLFAVLAVAFASQADAGIFGRRNVVVQRQVVRPVRQQVVVRQHAVVAPFVAAPIVQRFVVPHAVVVPQAVVTPHCSSAAFFSY